MGTQGTDMATGTLFRLAHNGPQVAEGGYTQTLKRSTEMENTNDISSEEQTGRLQQPAVMGSASRLPEGFLEYSGEELMSNFDGRIIQETADAIKGKSLFSRYSGWNFNGMVWWMDDKWLCEVWCYGSWQETVARDTLQEIMEEVCSRYGSD